LEPYRVHAWSAVKLKNGNLHRRWEGLGPKTGDLRLFFQDAPKRNSKVRPRILLAAFLMAGFGALLFWIIPGRERIGVFENRSHPL